MRVNVFLILPGRIYNTFFNRTTVARYMDYADYIVDLEEEVRTLRSRNTELEEENQKLREELRISRERKVEETDEGVPPEGITHKNPPKKEETSGPNLGVGAVDHEVKPEVKPKELQPIRGVAIPPVPTGGGSTAQPQREPSPAHSQKGGDDVIIVDPPQQSPGKRKNEGDQPSPRPAKRHMFWVEVPPRPKRKRVASVPVKSEPSIPEGAIKVIAPAPVVKEEPDQEVANALAVIRNTSLKKDKKSLDDVTVFTRLSKIGLEIFPITIEDEVKRLSISRGLLSTHFGGSSVSTFPRVGPKRVAQHGFDNFMCINLTLHPHAPSLPGAPGLWMDCTDLPDGWFKEDKRLVVRVKATSPTLWQYMGQYHVQPSDPLSLQEWTMQSEQTKKAWVEYIHEKKWGESVRARIKSRMCTPGPGEVTEVEIRQAFDKGEERLCTWSLKCRGYDERFQREIWKVASAEVKREE